MGSPLTPVCGSDSIIIVLSTGYVMGWLVAMLLNLILPYEIDPLQQLRARQRAEMAATGNTDVADPILVDVSVPTFWQPCFAFCCMRSNVSEGGTAAIMHGTCSILDACPDCQLVWANGAQMYRVCLSPVLQFDSQSCQRRPGASDLLASITAFIATHMLLMHSVMVSSAWFAGSGQFDQASRDAPRAHR